MPVLSHLFSPIKIGKIEIKNRLVMPAMSVNFGVNEKGFVTDQLTKYFIARAKGGTGMLIVGGGGIDPLGHELPQLPALWDHKCIDSLEKMIKKVKSFDVKFGMQIMHGGRQTYHYDKEAPSPISAPAVVKGIPKELTLSRIKELINAFGNSARYCKDAGFDFIEIHAAHGYLINQFMAENSNHRTDRYGGSFNNRIRFLLEVIENIKIKTSDTFPIGVRLNGEDYIHRGWTLNDSIKLAPVLQNHGINYLHVSAGVYGATQLTIPSMYVKQGCFIHLATSVKKEVSIPVIAVGRIRDPEFADEQIRNGKADMIAMGRAHLADPNIASKAIKGNLSEIRPCIGCCVGCIDRVLSLESATCAVNPKVGIEYIIKTKVNYPISKKILVIGAGLSGLSAAREAALNGHNVVIIDKASSIGGIARIAAVPPGRSNIIDIISFMKRELHKLRVEIRLNVSINEQTFNTIIPDEVIIAIGNILDFPIIKNLSKIINKIYSPVDILSKRTIVGYKIIILGGRQLGLVSADYISEKGKEVIVLHRGKHFAEDMASNDRFYLRERLKNKKVKLYKQVKITNVSDKSIFFHCRNDKQETEIKNFDSFVIAEKLVPRRKILEFFRKNKTKVHVINAEKTKSILDTINNGKQIAALL